MKIQNINIWGSGNGVGYRACILLGRDFDDRLIRRTFEAPTLKGIWDKIEAEESHLQRGSVDAYPSKS